MDTLIFGGYAAFFCLGYLLASANRQDRTEAQRLTHPSPEQEQLDRQWQALFNYDPYDMKEELDEDEQ